MVSIVLIGARRRAWSTTGITSAIVENDVGITVNVEQECESDERWFEVTSMGRRMAQFAPESQAVFQSFHHPTMALLYMHHVPLRVCRILWPEIRNADVPTYPDVHCL